jgi:type I restriction enzyme S subunit
MNRPQITFGEISELRNGVNFVVADQGVTTRVVGVGDFQARSEISEYDDLSEIQLKGDLSPEDELRDGDLLFVRSNGNKNLVGRCLVIRRPPRGITFSGFTIRARLDKSTALPDYIALVFQGGALNRQIALAGGGNGNISNLNQSLLASLPLTLPDLNDQKHVVTCVSTWNAAIETTEKLIVAKERHYTHELSRLISRGHHPRGHVGSFAREISERNCGGNEARVLSVTNSRGFVLPEDQFERRVASADLSNYKVVRRGQYAYNPSRINVGSIARLDGWDDGVLSPMYVVFGLDEAKVDSDYFLHWLDSHEARERIKKSAQGSVRETVSFSEFASLAIPLPDIAKQGAIARYLNALREEIALLGQSVDAIKQQKRGLMQKLLTGQWRVKVPETEAA